MKNKNKNIPKAKPKNNGKHSSGCPPKINQEKKRTSKGSGRRKTTVTKKLSEIQFDLEKIEKIAAFYGSTDEQLASLLGVDERTICRWKEDDAFLSALKKGKQTADKNVTESLYHRAIGYQHAEDVIMQYKGEPVIVPTIKHYPPDTVACIFWLKNRDKENWRDSQNYEHSGSITTIIQDQRESEIEKELTNILEKNKISQANTVDARTR